MTSTAMRQARRHSTVRRLLGALPLLGLLLGPALSGCSKDAPAIPLETVPLRSPIHPGDALYPAEASALSELAVTNLLPADTSLLLVAKNARTLIEQAGMTALLQKAEAPYDRALSALAEQALGLPLANLEALRKAGLDPDQPVGVAYLDGVDGVRVVFASVRDGEALEAALREQLKASGGKLKASDEGSARLLRLRDGTSRDSAVVLRDGHGLFLSRQRQRDDERVDAIAKELATAAAAKGLGHAAGFKQAVVGLRFGPQLALYATPRFWNADDIARLQRDRDHSAEQAKEFTTRLKEMDAKAAEQAAGSAPSAADAETRGHFERYIKMHNERHSAAAAKLAAIASMEQRVPAVAVGFEVGTTGLRYKLFAAVAQAADVAPLLTVNSEIPRRDTPVSDPSAAASQPRDGAETWTSLRPQGLFVHATVPAAHLPGAVEEAFRRARLGDVAPLLDEFGLDFSALSEHLSGELLLRAGEPSRDQRLGQHAAVVLRLKDGQAARAAWSKAIQSERGIKLSENKDLVPGPDNDVWRFRRYHIGFARQWVVIADSADTVTEQIRALDAPPAASVPNAAASWLASVPEPGLASLAAFEGYGGALVQLPAGELIPGADGKRVGLLSEMGVLGMLRGDASGVFSANLFGKLSKKAERLQKKIDISRAKLESLKNRQQIATESGRQRLLTALGSSLLWLRPVDGGIAGYGAQIFGEPTVADVSEAAVWLLIDSSSSSDTAREIDELSGKLAGLERALRKMDSKDKFEDGGAGLGVAISNLGGSAISSSLGSGSHGGFGRLGAGRGGGGTESLGGLGTRGLDAHGVGTRGGATRPKDEP